MPVGHPDVFFREVSIHVVCPFLHWVICFSGVEFGEIAHVFVYELFAKVLLLLRIMTALLLEKGKK